MKNLKSYILGDICEAAKKDDVVLQSHSKEALEEFSVDKLIELLNGIRNDSSVSLLPVAAALISAMYEPKFPDFVKLSWYKDANVSNTGDDKLIDLIFGVLRKKPINNKHLKSVVCASSNLDDVKKYLPTFNITKTGNIFTQVKSNNNSHISKLSDSFLSELSKITIQKKGVSVGTWEVLLQTLFNNIFRPQGNESGDCKLEDGILEVKGDKARLGFINPGNGAINILYSAVKDKTNSKEFKKVLEVDNFLVGNFESQIKYLKMIGGDLDKTLASFFNNIFECGCDVSDVEILSNLILSDTPDAGSIKKEYNLLLAACNLNNYKNKFNYIIFINNTSGNYVMFNKGELSGIAEIKNLISANFTLEGNLTTKNKGGSDRDKYSNQITYNG